MTNSIISVLILIVALFVAFLVCVVAEKLAIWLGVSPTALVPAAIVTIILYPILRNG